MNVKHGNSATRDDIAAEKARMDDPRYWERADKLARQPDREASLGDEDGAGLDWSAALVTSGGPDVAIHRKQQITLRIDRDVIDWFKSQGEGYQTRMNAVLRHYVEHEKKVG